ncbi:HEPN domain-containing protein [Streptomyces sp. NPDC057116]|uniref:HEPN domain-containing protein n=1 Tax=Streptomyces sp. NPDC057116 TaxID=3346023 RepID=UPI00362AAF27
MSSSWPPRNVVALRQAIEPLADWVKNTPASRTDDEKIWLVRFFVVRTCGYLEQVVYECARAYVDGKSGGPVRSFSQSWIARSRNPSPENMLELAGRFGGQFEDSLRSLLDDDDQRLYRELALLVDRRHKIAHGLNEGLTGTKALALYECSLEVAAWFLDNLNPHNSPSRPK